MLFNVKGTPEIWKAENGTAITPAIFAVEENKTRIPVTFKVNELMFFVFNSKTPENFINKVFLDGKHLFPLQKKEKAMEIPIAEFNNGNYSFATSINGNYTFETASKKMLKKMLEKPKVFTIEKYTAQLDFTPISSETIAPITIAKLKSLTAFEDTAIKYFAGKVKYTIRFSTPKDFASSNVIALNLGAIDATAEVYLNGKLINYAWLSNADINISGLLEKENELVITLANVCRNRIIGDKIMYDQYKNIFTTVKYNDTVGKEISLNPSGVIELLILKKHNKTFFISLLLQCLYFTIKKIHLFGITPNRRIGIKLFFNQFAYPSIGYN